MDREYEDKSYRTAMPRKTLSSPMRTLQEASLLYGDHLDYGCGRGSDADTLDADKYDPHYFPDKPLQKYDTITCIYVFNVLEENSWELHEELIQEMQQYLTDKGTIYIAVRRNLEKEGTTSIGTRQWNVTLPLVELLNTYRYTIYATA